MTPVPSTIHQTCGFFEQTWEVNGHKVAISQVKGGLSKSAITITLDGRRVDTALTLKTARARAQAQIAKLQEAA